MIVSPFAKWQRRKGHTLKAGHEKARPFFAADLSLTPYSWPFITIHGVHPSAMKSGTPHLNHVPIHHHVRRLTADRPTEASVQYIDTTITFTSYSDPCCHFRMASSTTCCPTCAISARKTAVSSNAGCFCSY